MKLSSGHKVEHIEGDELKKQEENFHGYTRGLIRLNPGRWFLPAPFLEVADKIYNFEVRIKVENVLLSNYC